MKSTKSKKELLLSAGLILTATLGLTACSATESTGPETNTGENVEVETQKPSTNEEITDSTATPEPEVETNSCTTENTEKKHPFGEIKFSHQDDYTGYSSNVGGNITKYTNNGEVHYNSIDFTKEELVAFYEQEVKGSDYDRVYVYLNDKVAITFLGTKGVFGISERVSDGSGGTFMMGYSNGFIQKDGTIVYSEELFETLNFGENYLDNDYRLKILNEKLSTYEIIDGFTEYGLHLYVDPSFIPDGTEEKQMKVIKEAITTIVSEVKEMPGYTTLQRLMIYFGGSMYNHNPIASLDIDFETLMTTDWDAFARGEFLLDGDEFYMSEPY